MRWGTVEVLASEIELQRDRNRNAVRLNRIADEILSIAAQQEES